PKPASASPIVLRDYQQDAFDQLRQSFRSHRRTVYVLPTGGGKTKVFASIIAAAVNKGSRVLVLAHRKKLVEQAAEAIAQVGVHHGLIMPGRSGNNLPVQIGMVATVANRLEKIEAPDLIVVDECHRATAKTYQNIIGYYPRARVLGVTATPQRTDGRGLGDIFSDLVEGPSPRALIDDGYLSRYRLFIPERLIDARGVGQVAGDFNQRKLAVASDNCAITGDAIEQYRRHADGLQGIANCVSRAHCEHVAEQFREAGIPAERIDGSMSEREQNDIIDRLYSRQTMLLMNCDLISEGVDIPGLSVSISLRPTTSLIVWMQQNGRVLRRSKGKEYAVVLDHAGNTYRHGFPCEPREWTLEGRAKGERRKNDRALAVSTCGSCFAAYPSSLDRCPHCNADKGERARTIEHRDGNLIEVTPAMEVERSIEAWRQSVRDNGRTPILWPAPGADEPMRADVWRTRENGEQGFKIRNES
ncbi:MAG: DEAD/DEAH box helicase, partial [Pseudomonadota bacterium]